MNRHDELVGRSALFWLDPCSVPRTAPADSLYKLIHFKKDFSQIDN